MPLEKTDPAPTEAYVEGSYEPAVEKEIELLEVVDEKLKLKFLIC